MIFILSTVTRTPLCSYDLYADIWPADGWSMNALREWGTFLRFGVPGMLMTCLDWWAFEFLTLITGKLPHPETAMAANMACS